MLSLQQRLQAHNVRLALTGKDALNKRQKRRIMQKVSKLKKEMTMISGGSSSSSESSSTSTSTTATSTTTSTSTTPIVGGKRPAQDSSTTSPTKRTKPNAIVVPSLNRAQRKKKIVGTNNRLKELARRKQLVKAEQCFRRAQKSGLLDVHTYTNMLNVYVRIGSVDRALTIFREMPLRRLQPNVVTYTTLLKGLGAAARFATMDHILTQMTTSNPPQLPTIRTVNTLMRSYARHGRSDLAVALFQKCQSTGGSWHINLDASTYEHLISSMSYAYKTQEIKSIIEQLRHAKAALGGARATSVILNGSSNVGGSNEALAGEADAAENPAIYIACARACALMGDKDTGRRMLQVANTLLMSEDVFLDRRTNMSRSQLALVGQGKGNAAFNARAMASKQHSRVKSMKEFAEHRVDDLQREMALLKEYLSSASGSSSSSSSSSNNNSSSSSSSSNKGSTDIMDALPQLLLLDGDTTPEDQKERNIIERLLSALQLSSGLNVLAAASSRASNTTDQPQSVLLNQISSVLHNSIDTNTEIIHFKHLLNKNEQEHANIPIKMEICSGNGEWATSCCAIENRTNKNTSIWVTMELRRDRK